MRALDPILRQLTVANQLTLLRLAAIPAFALFLLEGERGIALAIFIGAAITDRLDGIAARRLGQLTPLGAFLDPAADKLMMLVTYVLLALPDHPRTFPGFQLAHHIPAWLTLLVVLRDVLIVVVALGLYLAHHQTRFNPTRLGKWNTGWEMVNAGVFLLANVWDRVPEWLLEFGVWSTATMLVASGVSYLLLTGRRMRQPDAT